MSNMQGEGNEEGGVILCRFGVCVNNLDCHYTVHVSFKIPVSRDIQEVTADSCDCGLVSMLFFYQQSQGCDLHCSL